MRYLLVVLLLAGCASPPVVKQLDPEAQAKMDAAIRQSCDFMVGPPRDSMNYLSCMEMVAADMK